MPRALRDHIAAIYAAAAEPDALPRLVTILGEAVDVDSAGMWLTDRGRILDLTMSADGVESIDPYMAYYHKMDPWGGAIPIQVNRAVLGSEKVSDATLLKSEFYNDFARHYGLRDPLGISLDLGPGLNVAIGLNRIRGKRLLSAGDKPLVEELGFHIAGALRLHHRFISEKGGRAQRGAAFDTLSFGAIICTDAGVIRYANRAAFELARRQAGIVLGDRSAGVAARTQPETERLRALVRVAARGTGGALRLTGQDGVRLSIIATPLPADDPTLMTGKAFLSLQREDAALSIDATTLRQLFGLSPMQAALCMQLAEGKTFEEAATERGIALSTARAHFKTILAKTNVQNLRDLLRLLATLPPTAHR